MKKLLLLAAMILPLALLTSCSDDDDTLTISKKDIVGNWEINEFNTTAETIRGYIAATDTKMSLIFTSGQGSNYTAIFNYNYSIAGDKLNLTNEENQKVIEVTISNLSSNALSAYINNVAIPAMSGNIKCTRIASSSADIKQQDVVGTWKASKDIGMAQNVSLTLKSDNEYNWSATDYGTEIGQYAICGSSIHTNGTPRLMIVKSVTTDVMELEVYAGEFGPYYVTANREK